MSVRYRPGRPGQRRICSRSRPPSAAHWLGADEIGRDCVAPHRRDAYHVGDYASFRSLAACRGDRPGIASRLSQGAVRSLLTAVLDLLMTVPTWCWRSPSSRGRRQRGGPDHGDHRRVSFPHRRVCARRVLELAVRGLHRGRGDDRHAARASCCGTCCRTRFALSSSKLVCWPARRCWWRRPWLSGTGRAAACRRNGAPCSAPAGGIWRSRPISPWLPGLGGLLLVLAFNRSATDCATVSIRPLLNDKDNADWISVDRRPRHVFPRWPEPAGFRTRRRICCTSNARCICTVISPIGVSDHAIVTERDYGPPTDSSVDGPSEVDFRVGDAAVSSGK